MVNPNLDMLARVSHAVINRLNFPKREAKAMTRKQALTAKLRPLLSFHDCEDVRQTCALQLHTTGALYRDARHKLKLSDWVACFRACRALLRIDRKAREDATDIAKLHDVAQTVVETERFTARRIAIARRIAYLRACINAAYHADKSRKRAFNRKRAMRFLRLVASQASACGLGTATVTLAQDTAGLRMAAMDFRRYCDSGEKQLERQAFPLIESGTVKSFGPLRAQRGKRVAIAA